ncbi:MAG: helix-turn-helix transcriptional regulator, partial [Clostridia bacterium]|nr:helix-turn-helix transcriptional regulator [Clostridia bacterium]
MKIGEIIRTLRLQHKWTQEQLADRLGVSYQSVSRWENHITYPDIEYLPALARCFSVSVDALFGGEDVKKEEELNAAVHGIVEMVEDDRDRLLDLIRTCRREEHNNALFADICEALRYSPLCANADVLSELRKSAELFFETCADRTLRAQTLLYYACLEEENHVEALLEHYSSEQITSKDYLLKERYLFRDEFDRFDTARQRYFHKQLCHLIDGDISLWRNSAAPMTVEHSLYENRAKLALLHSLCEETPTDTHPITCGNVPDVFVGQRIYVGLRQACALIANHEIENAYAVLEDVISLMEDVWAMADGAKLHCSSPSLNTLAVTVHKKQMGKLGTAMTLS